LPSRARPSGGKDSAGAPRERKTNAPRGARLRKLRQKRGATDDQPDRQADEVRDQRRSLAGLARYPSASPSDREEYFSIPDARAFTERQRGKGIHTELIVYQGAGHAFFNDARPAVYEPTAANDAWRRTLALFGSLR
jgi:acetyl esterase/lipase